MILKGYTWSTGRETLYSVGGRWMNGYGALVEWYRQGNTEVLGEKHCKAWVVGEWMGMEHWWNDRQGKIEVLGEKHYTAWVVGEWMGIQHWWNDIDRGKPKCWEKKTCPSVTLSTTNITLTALGSNQGLCYEKVVTNCLSHSVPFEAQGHQINAKNSVPTSQETSQPPKTNQSM